MSSWKQYKQTFKQEPDLFDHARAGDLRGLADLLTADPSLDLNAINHRGYSALMLAVYNGQDVFCEALLRGGADPDSADALGNTVLMAAAFKGNIPVIDMLLQFGADSGRRNHAGMTAADWASAFGRNAALIALRRHGATQTSRSGSLLKVIRLAGVALRQRFKRSRGKA